MYNSPNKLRKRIFHWSQDTSWENLLCSWLYDLYNKWISEEHFTCMVCNKVQKFLNWILIKARVYLRETSFYDVSFKLIWRQKCWYVAIYTHLNAVLSQKGVRHDYWSNRDNSKYNQSTENLSATVLLWLIECFSHFPAKTSKHLLVPASKIWDDFYEMMI